MAAEPRADEQLAELKMRLKPLLLNKEVEIKEEIGRGAYGVVNEVRLDGTLCAGKTLHDFLVQVLLSLS